MELLDATSIQFLRRTNRIFLRLFSSPCFRGQYNLELISIPQPSKIPYFPWARPSRDIEAAGHTPLFVRYLEREAKKLCRDCKVAAGGLTGFQRMQSKSLVNKSLLRTGCEVYHPMMYFSSAQRQPWMDATRICIGREDHVRLSEYLVIGWDALVEAARDLEKRDPGSKDDTMATPGTSQPLLQCYVVDYVAAHHDGEGRDHPSLELYHARGVTAIRITWRGHVALPDTSLTYGKYPRGETLHHMQQLRLRGAARFIVPTLGPGNPLEMRLFDANRCGLLDDANAAGTHTSTPDAHYKTCRLHSDCSLRNHGTSRGRTIDPRSGHRVYTGSHVLRTVLGHEPRVKGSENGWSMSVNPCKRSSGCLGVLYTHSVGVLRKNAGYVKVPHVWLEAVDPDSYGLVYDREAYAILWCRDEACANYYRYSERPLVQRCRHRLGRTADWFRTYARPT